MRAAGALLMMCSLGGCAGLLAAEPQDKTSCPGIRSAEAWVNTMPGTKPRTEAIIILIEFDEPRHWQLLPIGMAGTVLNLDLVEGGAGHPGSAGYRHTGSPRPATVNVSCEGELVRSLTDIQPVR